MANIRETHTEIVGASPATCRRLLADVEQYPEWYPRIVVARIVSRGNPARIRLVLDTPRRRLAFDADFRTSTSGVVARRIAGDFDQLVISWDVRPSGWGSEVTVAVDASIGGLYGRALGLIEDRIFELLVRGPVLRLKQRAEAESRAQTSSMGSGDDDDRSSSATARDRVETEPPALGLEGTGSSSAGDERGSHGNAATRPDQASDGHRTVASLALSLRTANALRRSGFHKVGDLRAAGLERLGCIPNLGATSLAEIKAAVPGITDTPGQAMPVPATRLTLGASFDDVPETPAGTHGPMLADEATVELGDLFDAGSEGLVESDVAPATFVRRPAAAGPRPSIGADTPITYLELDVRTHRRLDEAGLRTVGSVQDAWQREAYREPGLKRALSSALERVAALTEPQVAAPEPRRALLDRRAREIVEMRLDGHTLRDIGARFGVTPERIRQILSHAEVTQAQVNAVLSERQAAVMETNRARITALFREGAEIADIAAMIGTRAQAVREFIGEEATAADRAARRAERIAAKSPVEPQYSHGDLIAAIVRVSEELGRVPSSGAYQREARRIGLPSLPTVANRFGSWSAAVRAAGMTPVAGRGEYIRRWSADACWRALRRLSAELGSPPTAQQYELLAASNDDLPSLATVRNRLGRWSTIVARLHAEPGHPILERFGIGPDVAPAERDEALWLAYLADDLTDSELSRLVREGLFIWSESYGGSPPGLHSDDDA
jgi:DNA-binding CsgD family transcriptional regulator/ribosome-associated toxin RatA of RatAB toxin-antitoxin module